MIDYDAELQLLNERFRAAYDIGSADRVLDIGCGSGQTTREVARLARDGGALGVDIDPVMIRRARELADLEGVPNVHFEVGDVEVYPFRPAGIDVTVSRFGTMFFAHPDVAFQNVASAMRAGGRLVMMVWQAHDRNEWAVSIDRAITGTADDFAAEPGAPDPFSLGEPETVGRILTRAGFTDVRFTDVDAPVYYGQDVDAALAFVSRFASVGDVLRRGDAPPDNSARDRLRETIAAHSSEHGVWFDARSWIVTAAGR
jgi:SAM-dependent methyltransferase